MARPIRETPILTGNDALLFEENMKRVENMSAQERRQNRFSLEESCKPFFNNLIVSI